MVKVTSRLSIFARVMFVIVCILLLFNFSRTLFLHSASLSFASFLNWLGSVNSMPINVSIYSFRIYADWGIINGLRNFINVFADLLGVVVYLFGNLINVIVFVLQFVRFLMVG